MTSEDQCIAARIRIAVLDEAIAAIKRIRDLAEERPADWNAIERAGAYDNAIGIIGALKISPLPPEQSGLDQ